MKFSEKASKKVIRIAIVESDPLRFEGFSALLGPVPDFELVQAALTDITSPDHIDIMLVNNRVVTQSFDFVSGLKTSHPHLRVIATGAGMDEHVILETLAAGARGYVDEACSAVQLAQAVRAVHAGSVWAPRHVLSQFIGRAGDLAVLHTGFAAITPREKEVLELLVAGCSNGEIAGPLGIEVRTVKAHMAKLMRKVGVRNRIALSTYAVEHSMVSLK